MVTTKCMCLLPGIKAFDGGWALPKKSIISIEKLGWKLGWISFKSISPMIPTQP